MDAPLQSTIILWGKAWEGFGENFLLLGRYAFFLALIIGRFINHSLVFLQLFFVSMWHRFVSTGIVFVYIVCSILLICAVSACISLNCFCLHSILYSSHLCCIGFIYQKVIVHLSSQLTEMYMIYFCINA